jgi:hypothetical protein
LRLIVETTTVPPGRVSAAQAATIDAGSGDVLEHLHARHDVECAGISAASASAETRR